MEKYQQRIWESMEENGWVSRSELYNLVGGKRQVENIARIANLLLDSGRVEQAAVRGKNGRTKTLYLLTDRKQGIDTPETKAPPDPDKEKFSELSKMIEQGAIDCLDNYYAEVKKAIAVATKK